MRGVTHTDRGRLSPCQVPHLVLDILSRTVYLQEFPAFRQGWLIIICDVSCKEYLDIFGFFVCVGSPELRCGGLWLRGCGGLWLRGCGGLLAFLFLGGGLGLDLWLEVRGVLPIGESCLEALPWLRGCGGLSTLSFLGCGLGLGVSLGMRGLLLQPSPSPFLQGVVEELLIAAPPRPPDSCLPVPQ